MKKIILSAIFTMAMVFTTNAQDHKWFIGGEFGFWSAKAGFNYYDNVYVPADARTTTWGIAPEIGYNISDKFAVAASVGYLYQKTKTDWSEQKESGFVINPYFRYTFLKKGIVSAFIDAGATFGISDFKGFEAGVKPGIAIALTDRFSLVAHLGFVGYNDGKGVGNYATAGKSFGIDFSGYQSSFGVYYSF
ncbi:MAG: hypothetical protein LBQ28_10220 [Prevotellaceae bacterium]|jgi:hypothetical protein|nr:hypothetical protein [Prevotellaceae bacterium]